MDLPEFLQSDESGLIRLTGHRIGLEDVVHFFNEGSSPEMIVGQFPTVPLPLIYKVIAFYLENREKVDKYITQEQAAVERHRAAAPSGPDMDELRRRLAKMHNTEVT